MLQALVTAAADDGQAAQRPALAPWRALCGGLPPAIPLAELRLAAAFREALSQQHHGQQAAPSQGSEPGGAGGLMAGTPSQLPPLLAGAMAGAALLLQQLWQRLGFLPPVAKAAADAAIGGDSMESGEGAGGDAALQHLRSLYRSGGLTPNNAAAAQALTGVLS